MKINYLRDKRPARFAERIPKYTKIIETDGQSGVEGSELYCFRPHSHSLLEVIYMLEGSISAECGDGCFSAHTGDLLIFNPFEPHSGAVNAEHPYAKYIVFNFEPEFLLGNSGVIGDETVGGIVRLSVRLKKHIAASDFTKRIGRELLEMHELTRLAEIKGGIALSQLGRAIILIGELIDGVPLENDPSVLRCSRFALSVNRFIETNYKRQIPPDELPKLLNISRSHFCYLFKKSFGVPLGRYLCDFRLKKALEYLSEPHSPQMNISELARSVGFTNYGYFSRCFKQKFGLSASDYCSKF